MDPTASSQAAPGISWREDLATIGRDLVTYRELLVQLTLRDLRVRYKQAAIGVLWAVLTPLVVVFAGWIVRVALGSLGGAPPSTSLMSGIAVKSLAWAFFVGSLSFATASVTGNLALVTKTYFPREVLPLAAVLTQTIDASIGALALGLVLPWLGVGLAPAQLWVLPLVLLLFAFTTAVALLSACANVFFRDARHLVQLVLSFGIFFTPVFFDASALGALGGKLAMLNPLAPILEGLRLALVAHHDLASPLLDPASGALLWSPLYLVYAALCSLGGLIAAALIFHRSEFVYAEYV